MDIKAFRGLSGTYNVRANERNLEKPLKTISCLVHFLDDTHHVFKVDKRAKGQVLLDMVFQHLELIENDFFSLKYVPDESQNQIYSAVNFFKTTFNSNSPSSSASLSSATTNNNGSLDYSTCYYNNQNNEHLERWLDPNQNLRKQIKSNPPHVFKFRVKFYVSDPSKLHDDFTRYLFFLQLRRDILAQRLKISESDAKLLASYVLQSELGDYNPEEHKKDYASEFKITTTQTDEMTKDVIDLHKQHVGQTPADAEYNFLDVAKKIECYGIEFYMAKDASKLDVQVGVSSTGIVVFMDGFRINTFSWAKIIKIMFKRKIFSVQLRREEGETFDNVVSFNLLTNQQCKAFWMSCAAHHSFFRLHSPRTQPKRFFSFFNFGSKFQYNGKTEYQTMEESRKRSYTNFARTPSKRYARQTVPVGKSSKEDKSLNEFCGRNFRQDITYDDNVDASHREQTNGSEYMMSNCKSSAFRPSSITLRSILYIDEKKSELSNPNKKNNSSSSNAVDRTNNDCSSDNVNSLSRDKTKLSNGVPSTLSNAKSISKNRSTKSDGFASVIAKKTNCSTKHLARISETIRDRFYTRSSRTAKYENVPEDNSRNISPESIDIDKYRYANVKKVKMHVGRDGIFGFKVIGGAVDNRNHCIEKCQDVTISKITPNSPADKCEPKLEVGDRVLTINGQMIDEMTNSEVIDLIKAIQTRTPPELILEVQSAAISPESSSLTSASSKKYSEPSSASRLSPISNCSIESNDKSHTFASLELSMQAIKKSLKTEEALEEFMALSRKKEEETFDDSKMTENIHKNRYRDILPYDSTRVLLADSMTGDYINASFVNMAVPNTRNVNRYIATQGPLSSTCEDFWQMIWEQSSSLIIMVTTLMEAGRVKCYKYWPDEKKEVRYGQLSINTLSEKTRKATIDRCIQVTDVKSGMKKTVTQVQYKSWPDHEVPDDCSNFLKLVHCVRKHRQSHPKAPVVVHCSAGIGRTGVLILMETAICLMEAGQPIHPLSILEDMRNQRAMLIQTNSQFQFVLNAICKVYDEQLFKRSKKHRK